MIAMNLVLNLPILVASYCNLAYDYVQAKPIISLWCSTRKGRIN